MRGGRLCAAAMYARVWPDARAWPECRRGACLANVPAFSSGNVPTVHTVFFEPDGAGAFVATPATAGQWSAQAQHGGPPSALAVRALERHQPAGGQRLARVAIDILRPVPAVRARLAHRATRASGSARLALQPG